MGKRERRIFTEEFKQEAVRLTETSGRTIGQVADDLGIGLSSLTRWKRRSGNTGKPICWPVRTRIRPGSWRAFARRMNSFVRNVRS